MWKHFHPTLHGNNIGKTCFTIIIPAGISWKRPTMFFLLSFRYYPTTTYHSTFHTSILVFLLSMYQVLSAYVSWRTAKTQYRKFETKIPRKEIARPLSQLPHSCVCVRFTVYIPAIGLPILLKGNMWSDPGIYKSLTVTWMWKLGLRPPNSYSGKT